MYQYLVLIAVSLGAKGSQHDRNPAGTGRNDTATYGAGEVRCWLNKVNVTEWPLATTAALVLSMHE